jgi:hypothetical protein
MAGTFPPAWNIVQPWIDRKARHGSSGWGCHLIVTKPTFRGANYYIKGDNLKLMAGVEYSELDGTERGTLKSTTLYGAVRMLY